MKIHETKQLLMILEKAYPSVFKNMPENEAKETIFFYHSFFGKYDTEVVVLALRNYVAVNQYPPTIAGLQEQINLVSGTEETAIELWTALQAAVSRSAWHSGEEFEKLPRPAQIWVRNAAGLKDLSTLDVDTFNTVTRGQFLKTIKDIMDREKVQDALPDNIKQLL